MNKLRSNINYLLLSASKWTTAVFAFIGLLGTFCSFDSIFDGWKWYSKLAISAGILFGIWCLCLTINAIVFYRKKWVEVLDAGNNNHVYVQYGDIFSPSEVEDPEKRRNIVVPVNCCFDTIVDDDIISSKSLHGIAFKRLYSNDVYSVETLNDLIQKDIKNRQNIQPLIIDSKLKRAGNLERFPIGTVAEISVSEQEVYFLLALSTFNHDLQAETSNEDYVAATMKLIEYCNARSQGYPVLIPLIGAGLSRTAKDEREILRYLVSLLRLNKQQISCDVHIVIRENGKKSISITDL